MSGPKSGQQREDERALLMIGVGLLVAAAISVVAGLLTGDSVWFFIGGWGVLYAAVFGALKEGER